MGVQDEIVQSCPCTCCPKYEELSDWADHLDEIAVNIERDDDYYLDVAVEIILEGWNSEFARVGIHNWRQSPQTDLELNQQAVQMQSNGETLPDDFFQEDLSEYFYGYSHFYSLTKSPNLSARTEIVQSFRNKAAAAREIADAGIEYCKGNSSYSGVGSPNTVLDYFCSRDPSILNQNIWNHLYATGLISYGSWEDATNEVLEEFMFRAAILAGVGSILFASRSILKNIVKGGTRGILKMGRGQFARLRLLAQRRLPIVRLITSKRVYRVEGGTNAMIHITKSGEVIFIKEGRIFWLNGGIRARAVAFRRQRIAGGMTDAQIKSFRIPRSFIRELDETAITEGQLSAARLSQNPARIALAEARPLVADVNKAPLQFGLRQSQLESLKAVIIQGSGRIE